MCFNQDFPKIRHLQIISVHGDFVEVVLAQMWLIVNCYPFVLRFAVYNHGFHWHKETMVIDTPCQMAFWSCFWSSTSFPGLGASQTKGPGNEVLSQQNVNSTNTKEALGHTGSCAGYPLLISMRLILRLIFFFSALKKLSVLQRGSPMIFFFLEFAKKTTTSLSRTFPQPCNVASVFSLITRLITTIREIEMWLHFMAYWLLYYWPSRISYDGGVYINLIYCAPVFICCKQVFDKAWWSCRRRSTYAIKRYFLLTAAKTTAPLFQRGWE